MKALAWRAAAVLAGGVFVFAGAIKTLDPVRFASDIENYRLVPWSLGVRVAFYLPWLEILCGAAVIVRRFQLGALAILVGLTSAFLAATVTARVRGIDVRCGCFGNNFAPGFWLHLAIDFALAAVLLVLLRRAAASSTQELAS